MEGAGRFKSAQNSTKVDGTAHNPKLLTQVSFFRFDVRLIHRLNSEVVLV